MSILDEINEAPDNLAITDALVKCNAVLRNHRKVLVSVSGGSDSDVMMDLVLRCGGKEKATFAFFNTGLEYDATKKQIQYLRDKYDVDIVDLPPIKPIPTCVREYGVPFWSKHVSEMISRLQRHNFKWEDRPFDELYAEYPKCKSALPWWCNGNVKDNGGMSTFNIDWTPHLKAFMVENPPTFKISNKCCYYAKKLPASNYTESQDFDLDCVGIRKAEGGIRASRHPNCFTNKDEGANKYRPLFWFSDADKSEYEKHYNIKHSDCYEVWGMTRTGCAGCPYGKEFEDELRLAEKYEPKFHKAMLKVFGESYEYTRKYLEFRARMKTV